MYTIYIRKVKKMIEKSLKDKKNTNGEVAKKFSPENFLRGEKSEVLNVTY